MQERVIELLLAYQEVAMLLSILLNIVISIFGVIPSFFITAANLIVFGFWQGLLLSFIGEALGAIVAFLLYRKGLKKFTSKKLNNKPRIQKLLYVKGKEAFLTILMLRFLPFVPSGLVTFLAAIGEVSVMTFVFASSLGKVPALVIEAYSVYHVTAWTAEGKLILTVVSISGVIYLLIKKRKGN